MINDNELFSLKKMEWWIVFFVIFFVLLKL
jgi:hypothetical protein